MMSDIEDKDWGSFSIQINLLIYYHDFNTLVFFLCLPGITWYYIKDLLFLAQLIHKKCSILFCFTYCNTELETIDTQNNVQSWSYLHMQRGRDRNIYRHIITVTVYKHNFLLSLPIKQCSTAEILIVKRELWTRSCLFY